MSALLNRVQQQFQHLRNTNAEWLEVLELSLEPCREAPAVVLLHDSLREQVENILVDLAGEFCEVRETPAQAAKEAVAALLPSRDAQLTALMAMWLHGHHAATRMVSDAVRETRTEFFEEAFTNPVSREPYLPPSGIRRAAERICSTFFIGGICDPMYIANVIALELGVGDGSGLFTRKAPDPDEIGVRLDRLAERLQFSYSSSIPSGANVQQELRHLIAVAVMPPINHLSRLKL